MGYDIFAKQRWGIVEDLQFETEEDEFECLECSRIIKVPHASDEPRPMTCEECGSEYVVSKNIAGFGLSVVFVNKKEEGEFEFEDE